MVLFFFVLYIFWRSKGMFPNVFTPEMVRSAMSAENFSLHG